jgi:hypothetical protein
VIEFAIEIGVLVIGLALYLRRNVVGAHSNPEHLWQPAALLRSRSGDTALMAYTLFAAIALVFDKPRVKSG